MCQALGQPHEVLRYEEDQEKCIWMDTLTQMILIRVSRIEGRQEEASDLGRARWGKGGGSEQENPS